MPEEIFIIIITGILSLSVFLIYVVKKEFEIKKIEATKGQLKDEINPNFLKAISDFKKNTERRIANLESIVADLEEEKIRIQEPTEGEITIEEKNLQSQKKEDEGDSNLRNMLSE